MEWRNINTAPKNVPISIVVQSADESDQRIIPNCMFDLDLGGSYVEMHAPDFVQHLSEYGELATHWGDSIVMPDAVGLYDDGDGQ